MSSLFLISNKENKHSLHVGALRNYKCLRATEFCIDSNYVFMLSHITMPHIDMTSVIFDSKMFNVHILLSGDFHRIELHMYAIYLCAIFLATLAFKLSLGLP